MKELKRNLIIIGMYSIFVYVILLPLQLYTFMLPISFLIGFIIGILNEIYTQVKKLNNQKSNDKKSNDIGDLSNIIEWVSVKNELPTNSYECIVKLWNIFNDSWETGIGIYDISSKKWEITNNSWNDFRVYYWYKTPTFIENETVTVDNSKKNNFPDSTILGKINRFEVIDKDGRSYVNYLSDEKIEMSLQDDNRTLKFFILKNKK